MKDLSYLTWQELRKRLDYSYHAGNGDETVRLFTEQRACFMLGFQLHSSAFPSSVRGQSAAWAAALFYNSPDLAVSPVDTSVSFETCGFLIFLLHTWADGKSADERQEQVLQLLQKRFEVNRRIFSAYDPAVKRIGDDFTCLDQYGLLALALQIIYIQSGCFSFMNTAIKLLDLVMLSGWSATNPLILSLTFTLEQRILNELQAA